MKELRKSFRNDILISCISLLTCIKNHLIIFNSFLGSAITINKKRVSNQVVLYFLMLMILMVVGCARGANISGTVTGDVSSGVLITLSGDYSESATTDSSGKYTFYNLNDGNYTVTPSLTGYTFNPASTQLSIANQTDLVANFTSTSAGTSSTTVPKFAYTANKSTNNISAYTIDGSTGALTYVKSVAAGSNPVSVTVDPTGKFVYVVNSNDDSIWAYTINQSTGELTYVALMATGAYPVSVTVDPSGKFVYAANLTSNNISVFAINQNTGVLTYVTTGSAGTAGVDPQSIKTTTGAI